jgi:2-haloacid dehalogenase
MVESLGAKPKWLTFDCYGTLIQWDEGLIAAVERILNKQNMAVDPTRFIEVFDRHKHALEGEKPHRSFRSVSAESLRRAMAELGLRYDPGDVEILTTSISKMPPFPEVVGARRPQADGLQALHRLEHGRRHHRRQRGADGRPYRLGDHRRTGGSLQAVARDLQACLSGIGHDQGRCGAYLCEPASRSGRGARHRLPLHLDRPRHGPQAVADYTPDRTFTTLDQVPAFFAEIGWSD